MHYVLLPIQTIQVLALVGILGALSSIQAMENTHKYKRTSITLRPCNGFRKVRSLIEIEQAYLAAKHKKFSIAFILFERFVKGKARASAIDIERADRETLKKIKREMRDKQQKYKNECAIKDFRNKDLEFTSLIKKLPDQMCQEFLKILWQEVYYIPVGMTCASLVARGIFLPEELYGVAIS